MRGGAPATLRPEPRGGAPALNGAARPGFIGTAATAARLDRPGLPLVRRKRRLRDRLGSVLAGSGLLHLVALVLLSLSFPHPQGGQEEDTNPVEMLYDNPGSAGVTGAPSPSPQQVHKQTDEPPPPPAEAVEVPPPFVVPDVPDAEALPPPEQMPQQTPQQVPVHRQPTPSLSALSHPMDLSFAQAPNARHQGGRPSGSRSAVDLSLGPMVQNGRLLTPYASPTSIRGVSGDYAEEIGDWIREHMYYPEDAAQRGEDGPSSVHVVLNRQGKVTSIRLVTSSGSYSLDDATQGMFRNATLPPVPPDMAGKSFDVDLTIDYILLRR